MSIHGIRLLFSFPGYVVSSLHLDADLAEVRLARDRRRTLRCPHCGRAMSVSRSLRQWAADLPLGVARCVRINYEAVQARCRRCGRYTTIRPPGVDEHAQATQRLMRFVSALCRHLPLNRVGEVVPGVDASKAYRWDRKVLASTLPAPKLDGLRVLLIDEKAVRKRHGYVTLVMNGDSGELLHLAEGKKKASLQSFFDKLNLPQKTSIEAVGMDRHGTYYHVVKQELPGARIVFDKFHLIVNYHGVIDRVRTAEWQKATSEKKKVFMGQRFNLFRNPANLRGDQRCDLAALLQLNANVNTVYVLKDALKDVWRHDDRAAAGRHLDWWLRRAEETAIRPLLYFARGMRRARDEVLNYCDYPITQGRLEGFNNLVSRLIHRACGIQDLDYLFLKLRQESLQ